MIESLLTPKDLAAAIGASESSLRRWIDNGDIRISRTAGGHRRIPLNEAVQFVRKIGAKVIRPEVLGLGELRGNVVHGEQLSDGERLFVALQSGDRELARGLMLSWYLDGRSLSALFDGPVRDAMRRLGELWVHSARGILVEHRASDICLATLAELRGLLPNVGASAPLAIGGAPQNDPYLLPTLMASAVLTDSGLRTNNFGANTPVELLAGEAIARGARLVWLSISAHQEPSLLRPSIKKLATTLGKQEISLVVGGTGAASSLPRKLSNVNLIGSMSELAAYAHKMLSGRRKASQS